MRRWNETETRELIARDIAWIVDHNGGAERVVVVDYPEASFKGKTLCSPTARRPRSAIALASSVLVPQTHW